MVNGKALCPSPGHASSNNFHAKHIASDKLLHIQKPRRQTTSRRKDDSVYFFTCSLSLQEVLSAAGQATTLLRTHAYQYFLFVVFILASSQLLSLLPHVGIFFYMVLPAIFGAQLIALTHALEMGTTIVFSDVFKILKLAPLRLALVTTPAIASYCAVLFFLQRAGTSHLHMDFITLAHSTSADCLQSRIAANLLLTLFFFLHPSLVLTKLGISALLELSLCSLQGNLLLLLFVFLLTVTADLFQVLLAAFFPEAEKLLTLPFTLLVTAWTPVFHYVIAKKIMGRHFSNPA